MRLFGSLALFLPLMVHAAADPGSGDLRKAKAYLREVRKHLLESYIDRERMKEKDLDGAAVRALAQALEGSGFADLDPDTRQAVKKAVEAEATFERALEAVEQEAPAVDLVRLSDSAAQAMVAATGDPFSRILTDQDMKQLLKMLQGGTREESAGFSVQIRNGRADVAYVQYGYPAYEEGVEIGDEVIEIRGRSAATVKPEDLPAILRLPAGDTLDLKIGRYGKDYRFKLRSRKMAVKDVRYEYLGKGVGYLRLTIFDGMIVREVRNALREMSRAGMKGVILDLRHNPGGVLPAATGVADLFLPQGLLITKTVSHYKPGFGGVTFPGFGGNMEFKTTVGSDFEEVPMVCLVDRASASASELLAGALRDHGRARLVGERTYGKGVGQTPIILSSRFMERYLYLTVLRYTTPHGDEVDGKGVQPDLAFSGDHFSAEKFDATWELRRSGAIEKYRDERWNAELRKLAEADGFDTVRYAGFDGFYESLKTPLSRDEVRGEIRRAIRRRMADEGKTWVSDLQTDRVLQRGLIDLLDRLGG